MIVSATGDTDGGCGVLATQRNHNRDPQSLYVTRW